MKCCPWFFENSISIYKVNCETTFIFKKLKKLSDAKPKNEEVVIGLSKKSFFDKYK